jgi:hypothetical protein
VPIVDRPFIVLTETKSSILSSCISPRDSRAVLQRFWTLATPPTSDSTDSRSTVQVQMGTSRVTHIKFGNWANAGQCCGLGHECSIVDDFWKSLPSSFHSRYVDYTERTIEYIARASSTDTSRSRATFVVGTGHACKEIITGAQYKPLATLAGVSNVHGHNKGSDRRSKFTWAPHFSTVTRKHMWLGSWV